MNSSFASRKYILIAIFVAVGIIFIARLFYIQIINDQYKLSANNNVLRYVTEFPARGIVYDRNGKLMVFNEAAYDLMVVPKQVKDLDTLNLCNTIGITIEQFRVKLLACRLYSPFKESIFEKQISKETYAALQEKLYRFNGFYVQARTLRKYPNQAAAHTLGYVGEASENVVKKDPYYKMGDYIGISGIEKSYEKELRGVKGKKIWMVDVFSRQKGRFMDGAYDTLAVSGTSLYSSLDLVLQQYGEELMRNKTGSIVAIEPSTGEILAVISSPSYDPNLLVGRERSKNYGKLILDTLNVPLFNRACMAYYPPGSTFKLVNGLIGQQEGVTFPSTRYPCSMGYPIMGRKPACHRHASPLNLAESVQHSCNSYYCYVFRSIVDQKKFKTFEDGYNTWRNHVLSFGVGKKMGTDMPQELRGMVPTVEYYNKVFRPGGWKSSTIVSLSIGQGELGITPLQMANIMCIIANHGWYYTPHVIKGIEKNNNPRQEFKTKNFTSIDEKYFPIIIDGMEQVVEAGTARIAKIKDISMCGKTGTAQNPRGKDHSLFVGFAPKNNPKIAIAVMVENAGFGATWAAPIASLMIEKYLKDSATTRPDLEKRMKEGIILPPPLPKKR